MNRQRQIQRQRGKRKALSDKGRMGRAAWTVCVECTAVCNDGISAFSPEGVRRCSHRLQSVVAGGTVSSRRRGDEVQTVQVRGIKKNGLTLNNSASSRGIPETITSNVQIPNLVTWQFGHLAI